MSQLLALYNELFHERHSMMLYIRSVFIALTLSLTLSNCQLIILLLLHHMTEVASSYALITTVTLLFKQLL